MKYFHGLVLGKFYPPHAGHEALIRTAAKSCQNLTVVVGYSTAESIPGPLRASWLRTMIADLPHVLVLPVLCEAPVDYDSAPIWSAQVAYVRSAVRIFRPGQPLDVVFTSEGYGPRLASELEVEHVLVDLDRSAVPVSATAVRADLARHWSSLPRPVRAGLAVRAVVLGAESTGTTTVAQLLAKEYAHRLDLAGPPPLVLEYGRQYTLDKLAAHPGSSMDDLVWVGEDFAFVASEQDQLENSAAHLSRLLVADTDALATRVWEHRYTGQDAFAAQAVAQVQGNRIYFVTDHQQVPFVQDGIRDGEHLRASMTDQFIDLLTELNQPWVLLSGTLDQRLDLARTVIDRLLVQQENFTQPLG